MPTLLSERPGCRGLFAGWLLALACLVCGPLQAQPDAPGPLRVDQALASVGNGAATPVALPDGWRQRGLVAKGEGRYELSFQLAALPQETWSLRFDRVALSRQVRLNGVVVESSQAAPEVWRHQRPLPGLIQLPAHLLRIGDNRVELELAYGGAGGLSVAELGPRSALEPAHELRLLLGQGLPQGLNLASAGLALFMLLVWAQRRRELPIGCFGLLWLLTSLRNVAYYVEGSWAYSDPASWFYTCVHAWGTTLLGLLALGFAGRRWPRYRQALLALALAWPLVAAIAIAQGEPLALRQWGYPVLTLLALPALWLLFQAARQVPSLERMGLAVGIGAFVLAALHDLLFLSGRVSVTSQLWQPLVMPLLMGGLAWFLVRRMVQAWSRVERLNADLELAVQERTGQLRQANEAKSRLLAAASHDLRQPLHAIALLGAVLDRHIRGGRLQPIARKLRESAGSMQALLNGLLDMSRLDLGSHPVRLEPIQLGELLQQLVADHAPSSQERGLALRLRLPRGGAPVWVESDRTLLMQVLVNLVSNAIRYTPQGQVLVALRRRGDSAWVEVWDTGLGIAAADQQRIFEEFVQLEQAPGQARPGLGLGLSIVRRSLERLALPLDLCSVPGQGSRFRLRIACVAGFSTDVQGAPDARPQPLEGLFLAVVDDDPAVRFAMQALLCSLGARVETAASAAEALALLEQSWRVPDALLVDYRLGAASGIELIEQLRLQAEAPLPAALITGEHGLEPLRSRVAGPTVVLQKPVDARALVDWLDAVVAGTRDPGAAPAAP